MKILLGITGSVAAVLTPKIYKSLSELGEVKVIMTDSAARFYSAKYASDIGGVYRDSDEWAIFQKFGDPILHIDLKNWADIFVIAPCSANTLAKMANGLSDNLLTSTFRAWPVWKPVFLAPSMNTDMWKSPFTKKHINRLTKMFDRFFVVDPQIKTLACGDHGIGAMSEISEITNAIKNETKWTNPLGRQPFIPTGKHPGSFGSIRKHDTHTGVDLYGKEGDLVSAVEGGIVVGVIDFTGSKVLDNDGNPMDWWNDTKAVLVKGVSGIVVYGEIDPWYTSIAGRFVGRGHIIGKIKAVLPKEKIRKDIPHHSNAMLHIEVYTTEQAEKDFRWQTWELNSEMPKGLIDPTPFLKNMKNHYE